MSKINLTDNSFVGAWLIFLVWVLKFSKFFDQKNDHWRHVAYLDIKSGALINFFTVLEVNRAVLNFQKFLFLENFLHHLQIQIRRKSKWEMNQSEAFIKEREYATRLRWFNWILLADGSKNATNSKYFGHTVWLILYKSWWLISMGSTELLCPNMLFEIDYSG